jgi:hypothetical protein
MSPTVNEKLRPATFGARENPPVDSLMPHLTRIVRRALRHPNDRSPMSQAVRVAAAQVNSSSIFNSSLAEEFRVRQVVQRIVALMAPNLREEPGRRAHLETVCA